MATLMTTQNVFIGLYYLLCLGLAVLGSYLDCRHQPLPAQKLQGHENESRPAA